MPRNLRYPYSPVQEIFLPEPIPFTSYNLSIKSQTSPTDISACPAAVSESAAACLALQSSYQDSRLAATVEGDTSRQEQAADVYRKLQQSVRKYGCLRVRMEDENFTQMRERLGPSGMDYSKLSQRDPRVDILEAATKSRRPPPLTSRYGL
eukprot:GHVS01033348.1.p1 GENE.GHVS01033348.1~~GHVS01033348.1.p1  ORF type:complete len:151 (-),score=28.54 GHVS01033348.1:179-631(-)